MAHTHLQPNPRQSPWPLAPVTVPLVLLVATALMGPIAHLMLSRLPFSDAFDASGTATFALLYGALLTGGLVVLGLFTSSRPGPGAALAGVAGTAVAVAVVASVAHAAIDSFRIESAVGNRDFFTNNPTDTLLLPHVTFSNLFIDPGTLTLDWDGQPVVFGTSLLVWAALLAVVGAGGALASGGGVRSVLGAGVGGAVGGAVGELVLEILIYQQRDLFFTDPGQTVRPTILLHLVIGGIFIGCGVVVANLGGGAKDPSPATPPVQPTPF
jgi:hypothetical protein